MAVSRALRPSGPRSCYSDHKDRECAPAHRGNPRRGRNTVRILIALLVTSVALVGVGVAIADPGLTNAPPHRHFIGGQEVGPRICDHPADANIQKAFNQFHANHHSYRFTGGQGPIAPGINDDQGPALTAGAC
jgi:hypothetical protein